MKYRCVHLRYLATLTRIARWMSWFWAACRLPRERVRSFVTLSARFIGSWRHRVPFCFIFYHSGLPSARVKIGSEVSPRNRGRSSNKCGLLPSDINMWSSVLYRWDCWLTKSMWTCSCTSSVRSHAFVACKNCHGIWCGSWCGMSMHGLTTPKIE